MKQHWLIGGLAGVFALGGLAFVQGGSPQDAGAEGAAVASVQPIAFPHDLHAGIGEGQANMNCQFCHFSAERSVDAGIPSVATCWGCHQVIPGANNPDEVSKIQGYVERGESIPWVRIYKISDHAHFPHMRHVNADITCQTCHGEVQEMGVLSERDPAWGGNNMGWCVDCHRTNEASVDCAVCHY
jgi:hypothetical protein